MTIRRQSRRRASVLLLLLCLGLGYALYNVIGSGGVDRTLVASAPVPPETQAPAPSPPPFALAPLEDFSETMERPLFLPSRRPLVAEDAPQQIGQGVERNLFTLMGVIIAPDERMAIVERRRTGDVLRLVEGQQVDGWLVDAILPDRMRLTYGEVTDEVVLEDKPRPQRKKEQRRQRAPAAERGPAEAAGPKGQASP
jgi:hypothetical protein